ncbi:MAG: hypothetical protein KDB00_10380 [Planctomycetales bacterium]|nr:hypothetical protein [Planctomycetales bacterium]
MNASKFARRGFTTSLILSLGWIATPGIGHAQVMLSPAFNQPKVDAEVSEPIRSLTLHPQGQPDPVLRYRLWPAPEKRRYRATMTAVNRALLLVGQVPTSDKQRFLDHYDTWSAASFDQFPVADAKADVLPFETAIAVLRSGENWMDTHYDLGIEEMSMQEKLGTLLPEFQETRDLARLLCVRARVAAAEKRWDDAIADLRLGFRLSEVAGHSTNTLLGRLIGSAISEVLMDATETMIQQPDCPNLYWALAGLPIDHLTEIGEAIEQESTLGMHIGSVAGLQKLPAEVIGHEESLERLRKISNAFSSSLSSMYRSAGDSTWNQMTTGFQITMMVQPSRELLAQNPDWKDRLSELSDAEVVLRASDFELSRIRDRWLAWSLLPKPVWQDCEEQRNQAMHVTGAPVTLGGKLARVILPDVQRAIEVGLDIRQTHHRLVTLEAIRMHADQFGVLPETITNLSPVPAWPDPVSRQPFQYAKKSATVATLARAAGSRNRDDITLEINLEPNQ